MTLDYNVSADVLTLSFGVAYRSEHVETRETQPGVLIRSDTDRQLILGCTITDFLKRVKEGPLVIPEIGPVPYVGIPVFD